MNNLANKQLAGKLLLEAVELLNESNARHKYIKLQEEKAEKMQKRSEHARSDDASIYEAKAKQARANIARYGTGASKGGYNGGIAYKFTDKSETDAKKTNLRGTSNNGKTFTHDALKENEVIYGGRLAREKFNDMVDKRSKNTTVGYSGKGVNYDLHERINKHGKKSQNESIAVLLVEAAQLLNKETD